jgi:ribosomal protein S18 acetylase RimI-like enzyme
MNSFKFEVIRLKDLVKNYFNIAVNAELFNEESRLDLLKSSISGDDIILSVFDNDKIIAVCALEIFEHDINFFYMKYITVDKDYRNKGIGSFLMEEKFKYAQDKNKGIVSSPFTKDGLKYLKEKDKCLAKKYDILYFPNEDGFKKNKRIM